MSMSPAARLSAILAVGSLCACGGANSPPSTPDSPKPSPSAAEISNAPANEASNASNGEVSPEPATAAPSGPSEPYARLLDVRPAKDDPKDRRAHIEFFNPTQRTCTFSGYTLRWGESAKEMPLGDVRIPAGNSRERFLLIHPVDGDIESLSVETGTIQLRVTCGP